MIDSYMIMDLQYGSTGKGLLAGYLAKKEKPDVVVTAWGPNAGHTYIDSEGRTFIHRMLANGIVSPNLKYVLIGPGSVIDVKILMDELDSCRDLMVGKWLVIHPSAAIVDSSHIDTEKRNVKIGSTMKGTGAAIIQRIERDPDHLNVASHHDFYELREQLLEADVSFAVDDILYRNILVNADKIQIEGAQGYSLSMYHGFYPYTTSRDVTPAQVLADCAIPYSIRPEVYGTLRTYPIRVSNRVDENGVEIGNSGPCYSDQHELNWRDLGMEPELTTVTKLPRRIFNFSYTQLEEACLQCAPDRLFLNFANYMTPDELIELIDTIEDKVGVIVEWIGVGPKHEDIKMANGFFIDELKSLKTGETKL